MFAFVGIPIPVGANSSFPKRHCIFILLMVLYCIHYSGEQNTNKLLWSVEV